MKKFSTILLIICFLIFVLPSFADEDSDSSGINDVLKYSNFVENGFEGQKKITDEDYQKALQEVKAKQNKKRHRSNNTFKGQGVNEENNREYLSETSQKNLLLGVPLNLLNGDGVEIPIGHYKIVGEKNKNNVYLNFYQSSTLIAHVPAIETNSDFDEQGINFVKLLPYDQERVKVIYGSLDFNAYTFIKIENMILDTN